ncbi:MAG TPA: hypothetical protein PKY87_07330 [Terricaulis sp.]|nr:hypothetical protein [Terricaulis sp.]
MGGAQRWERAKLARDDVTAAIVAFGPDAALITALVRQAAAEAGRVIVFANSPLEPALAQALAEAGAELIAAPHNLGVAEAFNMCAANARALGAKRLLLLDQDSEISEGLIAQLGAQLDALEADGARPALIGPMIVSPPGGDYKAPRYFKRGGVAARDGARPVQYVISSGSLIDLAAFEDVGPFRSEFFIDAIDTEWCFRAWARGKSCWVADDVRMVHRIGQGAIKSIGARVPRQPDFRIYAFVRNQAYCLTLPHLPLWWKLRFFAHIGKVTLTSWAARGFRFSFIAIMAQAFCAGLAGKLGPPPGAVNAGQV